MMEFPPYRLDRRAVRLWRDDQPMALRPKAWALLCCLAERPGILTFVELSGFHRELGVCATR